MKQVTTNPLGRFFSNVRWIEIQNSSLLVQKSLGNKEIPFSDINGFVRADNSIFGKTLSISLVSGVIRIRFLRSASNLSDLVDAINVALEHTLNLRLDLLESQLASKAIDRYLQDSMLSTFQKLFDEISSFCDDQTGRLSKKTWKRLKAVSAFFPIESQAEARREDFERKCLFEKKEFFDSVEKNPLTQEQRLAVIRDNDRNLVLAAAGTGKTSVIVSKALFLIDAGWAKPEEILVLAFGNAAAQELRERLAQRAQTANISTEFLPEIRTFHALGREITRSVRGQKSTSIFVEDRHKFYRWVTSWLEDQLLSSPKTMRKFIKLLYVPYNEFDFKTEEEYEAFLRDNPFRALSGDLVKSGQELAIANWFHLNGVPFEYENRYVTKRRLDPGVDYKPDFDLGNGLYLEHFGIDRNGNTRVGVDPQKYQAGIEWKRELHEEHGTTLLETYSYEGFEEILEDRLAELMQQNGIKTSPLSNEEVFEKLNSEGVITRHAELLRKCLEAIRVDGIDLEDIEQRMLDHKVGNEALWSEFIGDLVKEYISELQKQDSIDFDDMILHATEDIASGAYDAPWKYVLVDEFQDISRARMSLAKAIFECPNCESFTAVGDDWQAIYRFSGGRLTLTTRFADEIGSHTESKLQETFRYNDSIADIAGGFVMENQEQIKKKIETVEKAETPQVYLIDDQVNGQLNPSGKLVQVIKTIRENDPKGSIAVIARYNYILDESQDAVREFRLQQHVEFWTFHRAKGLEADYTIVVGLFSGDLGFPNARVNEAPLEALLPELDGYPFSEERRLFYVGLTRARYKCYLIASPLSQSSFVRELLTHRYAIEVASKTFASAYLEDLKCPRCSKGYFQRRSGTYGDFYVCSTGIACDVKANVCPACEAPVVDSRSERRCISTTCGHAEKICPQCGRPMRIREGSYGKFWGCSGFGDPRDQCRYKERA